MKSTITPTSSFTVNDAAHQNCRASATRARSPFELPARLCSKADLRRNLIGILDEALDLIADDSDITAMSVVSEEDSVLEDQAGISTPEEASSTGQESSRRHDKYSSEGRQ